MPKGAGLSIWVAMQQFFLVVGGVIVEVELTTAPVQEGLWALALTVIVCGMIPSCYKRIYRYPMR
jgi:hypothetical protein